MINTFVYCFKHGLKLGNNIVDNLDNNRWIYIESLDREREVRTHTISNMQFIIIIFQSKLGYEIILIMCIKNRKKKRNDKLPNEQHN